MKKVLRIRRERSALTETQRTQALKRFQLIRPFLTDRVPLPHIVSFILGVTR